MLVACGSDDDTTNGGSDDDNFNGGDGDDIIYGSGGGDTINGGGGDDTIYGHDGNDTINGGEGDDTIRGGGSDDTINGGDGDDRIYGDDGNDYDDYGDDTIDGGDGNDYIDGGDGNDTINGGDGGDTIYGDEGNDRIIVSSGNDRISGGSGYDTLVVPGGYFETTPTSFGYTSAITNGTYTVHYKSIEKIEGTIGSGNNGGNDNVVEVGDRFELNSISSPNLNLSFGNGFSGAGELNNVAGTFTLTGSGSITTSNYIVTSLTGTWEFDDGTQSFIFDFGDDNPHAEDQEVAPIDDHNEDSLEPVGNLYDYGG